MTGDNKKVTLEGILENIKRDITPEDGDAK